MIILDPDDQPMWESAKTIASTPNFAVISPEVDDKFVINSTHLKMIRENKFDGYLQADPHDHIREFLAICDMFKYGETQSEAVKLLIFPFSLCDKAKTCLKEELQDMRNKYNELRDGKASKNCMNDDTRMCERHEANCIQSEGYQNRDSHDPYSHQSLHDPNESEKSLTELNNDVKNDLEYFKRCIRSMRTVHSKLYERDDQSKTDLEKTITKFLDGQRVTNMYVKNNVKDMILKMKQNEKNFQTIFKNMERKMDEWEKSQNVSLEKNRYD
ncbi:hypothetical protein Tco_0843821 [Tanacetum coccineum]